MKTRWLRLAIALLLGLPGAALAVDAPHDASYTSGSCLECHKLHNATGGALTNRPTMAALCQSCHSQTGRPPRVNWSNTDQAVPDVHGTQHNWSASTTSTVHGALPPLDANMLSRTTGGLLSCAVCHDVHRANAAYAPSQIGTNVAIGTPQANTGGAGGGQMTLQPLGANPVPHGYQVRVVAGGGFVLSHDFGSAAPTWYIWSGGAWVIGTNAGPGKPFTVGTPVTLDDPAVSVTFSGAPVSGDYWNFYVAYPFLRAANDVGQMCVDCHRDRNQNHAIVEGQLVGYGWGGKPFSHPVGQTLNANLANYDRAAPLDADGGTTGAGAYGNPTSTIKTYGGNVQCISCHSPHNTDSNALTVDPH